MIRRRGPWLALALVLAGCVTAGNRAASDGHAAEPIDAAAITRAEAELVETLAREVESGTNLRAAYARYLTLAPSGPARSRRAIEYAELLLAIDADDEAALHLREAVTTAQLDVALRARASRLMIEALTALWRAAATPERRIEAATRLRARLLELQAETELWKLRNQDGAALREQHPSLILAATWDIAMSHKHLGLEHGRREAFASCTRELIDLFNTYSDHADPAALLAEAADCAIRAYQISDAIRIRTALTRDYPDAPQAPDALFALAETYQSVLFLREALDSYREFSDRYPADGRVTLARARWLQLAVTLDDPIAEIVAGWHDSTLDPHLLAAAVEFREAQQSGEVAAMSEYLARHRTNGGPAREIAARVALATDAMARSCPDAARATGLCTTQTIDGRLGEVLRRDRDELRQAQRQLHAARALLEDPAWTVDPIAIAGPPLALDPEELRELEATVALLVGDLSAEEALGVQPPRTYEASRTRIWLDERKRSVAAMVAAYETVGSNDPARAAAAAERRAQIYESDATLLARVGLELRERGEAELATELALLETERLSQCLAAYQQCLEAIAAYGDDPTDIRRACQLGVGRLAGVHEVEVPWVAAPSLRALLLGAN